MEWTPACPGEGRFWRCHLTCHFFLKCWRQVPSAPDPLCCLDCGSQFPLAQFLPVCWCSPYFCFRPVCFTAKRLSITPKLTSSSGHALTVQALALPLTISHFSVLVILPSSRATPFPSESHLRYHLSQDASESQVRLSDSCLCW